VSQPAIPGTQEAGRQAPANRLRLTLASFLSYFILAGLISQIGVITAPMAAHFDRSLTEVAGQFTWLSMGISAGALLSLVYFEWSGLRRSFLACYSLAGLALLSLVFVNHWALVGPALAVVGVFGGLGLNASAVTLALSYSETQRPRILLITDLCFAAAGIVMAPLAAKLIAQGLPWSASYALLALMAGLLLVLASCSEFPPSAREAGHVVSGHSWPPAAWLCGLGLMFYLFGQVTMLIWLPTDATMRLGADSAEGASLISRYWSGMAIGQLILVVALRSLPLRGLLAVIAALSVLASLALWLSDRLSLLMLGITALGLCNAGVLKLSLSFGATLVQHPQRIVTALLFCGSFGQAVCPYLSARFVAQFDSTAALQLTSGCLLLVALCLIAATAWPRSQAIRDGRRHPEDPNTTPHPMEAP
jgi:TsgA-like MFS transporter